MSEPLSDMIVVGRLSGIYGVRGWLRVLSYTQPRDNILRYHPWYLNLEGEWQPFAVVAGRRHGKGIVAQLETCVDRDMARRLVGADIGVRREQLPEPESGEYYWTDLIGLRVVNAEGVELGHIDHLLETGANDVLVVKGDRERLIPYVRQVVLKVDLEQKVMSVDWDAEF